MDRHETSLLPITLLFFTFAALLSSTVHASLFTAAYSGNVRFDLQLLNVDGASTIPDGLNITGGAAFYDQSSPVPQDARTYARSQGALSSANASATASPATTALPFGDIFSADLSDLLVGDKVESEASIDGLVELNDVVRSGSSYATANALGILLMENGSASDVVVNLSFGLSLTAEVYSSGASSSTWRTGVEVGAVVDNCGLLGFPACLALAFGDPTFTPERFAEELLSASLTGEAIQSLSIDSDLAVTVPSGSFRMIGWRLVAEGQAVPVPSTLWLLFAGFLWVWRSRMNRAGIAEGAGSITTRSTG